MATRFKTPYWPRVDEGSVTNSELTLTSLAMHDEPTAPVPAVPYTPYSLYSPRVPQTAVTLRGPFASGRYERADAPYGLPLFLALAGLLGAVLTVNWASQAANAGITRALVTGVEVYATPSLARGAALLNTLGAPTGIALSVGLLAGILVVLRKPLQALTLVIAGGGSLLVVAAFRALVARFGLRELAVPSGAGPIHSFPSVQAVYLVTVCLPLVWFLCERGAGTAHGALWGPVRGLVRLALVLVPFVGGIVLIAFGAAWPADVLAGYEVGVFWVGVVLIGYLRARQGLRRGRR